MPPSDLVRLCYASEARFNTSGAGSVEAEVGRILMQSRRNNPKQKIGGVLYYGNGYFFQCLEGPRAAVESTYKRIAGDQRHQAVKKISLKSVERRLFKDWSMKYVAIESTVAQFLKKYKMPAFQPLQFGDRHVDELLNLFANAPSADNVQQTNASEAREPTTEKSSWFRTLFKRAR